MKDVKKRAEQADRILKKPLGQEAFELIESNLKDKWESTKFSQSEEREKIYMQLHAFHEFRRFFVGIIKTGEFKEKMEQKNANGTTEHRKQN